MADTGNSGTHEKTSLAARFSRAPKLSQARKARERFADLVEAPESKACATDFNFAPTRAVLEGIADHSSYLWRLAERDPERLARLLTS